MKLKSALQCALAIGLLSSLDGVVVANAAGHSVPRIVGARSAERIGEDLVSLAERASHAVHVGSASCQLDPEVLLPGSYGLNPVNRIGVCLFVDEYAAAKKPIAFAKGDPPNICSAVWENGAAPWANIAVRKSASLHGTRKKALKTRAEFLQDGWSVLSPPEQGELVSRALELRSEVAKSCCGTDVMCEKSMNAVFVGVCQSAADKNPNSQDVCGYANGAYDHTNEEKLAISGMSYGAPPKKVQSGSIVLSPYLDQHGDPLASDHTIRHEFGHACSSVRRQLAVLTKQPSAFNASESLNAELDGACELDEANKLAYSTILSQSNGVAAPNVLSCLQTLSIRAGDPKSSVFIEENCKAKKLEEGVAEAVSISSAKSLGEEILMNRICRMYPSSRHAAGADVLSCLLKNDPRVRAKFAKDMQCGAKR